MVLLSSSNQLMQRNDLALSMMFITHIHAVKCTFGFQNRWYCRTSKNLRGIGWRFSLYAFCFDWFVGVAT
jgi:hypothetical protein